MTAPFDVHRETVRPEWIDYNGHMNVAYYLLVFDHATDALLDRIDLGEAYRRRSGQSLFVVATHLTFGREAAAGERLAVSTQTLGHDGKRLHLFHRMRCETGGEPVATAEVMLVHVDLGRRRASPFPADAAARLAALADAHTTLPPPPEAGRGIAPARP